jgi:hypothetical protein
MTGNGMIIAADQSAATAERQLLAAVERAARHPLGKLGVVLHLSGLHPPAPRPHHLRIARALMHDVALHHDGQTFLLRNGDIVLLCRTSAPGKGPSTASLATLPATLARLFRRDMTDAAALISVWPLAGEADRLLAYAATRLATSGVTQAADDSAAPAPEVVNRLDTLIAGIRPADLIQRQTAALLAAAPAGAASGQGGLAGHLRPLYQELGFSMELIEAHAGAAGQIARDPFLLQHLAVRLDARLLQSLQEYLRHGGPLDPQDGSLPLHINVTLPGLLSTAFASLALACHGVGRPLAAEVLLVEAAADPAAYAAARARAGQLGVTLVLDGVSHLALLLAEPWQFRPDLLKLDWSARLPHLAAPEQAALAAAVREIGPARLILHRSESEAAIRWGIAQGIRRFQGRHIDSMLGASRIVTCSMAAPCTLRQCVERAGATGGAARACCRNHPLLDAGSPATPAARQPA